MKINPNYEEILYFDDKKIKKNIAQNRLNIARIKTPFGDLLAGATLRGICLLEFTDTDRVEMQLTRLKKAYNIEIEHGSCEFFPQLNQQLEKYFSGSLQAFDIPLDLHGTDFQLQVWQALQEIPYGETRSYQEQAIAIGKPKATRAVANANRNNKISILVPCHRVIGKNGQMRGYGGGIWRKKFLLDLESR